jgi:hypothetical protein
MIPVQSPTKLILRGSEVSKDGSRSTSLESMISVRTSCTARSSHKAKHPSCDMRLDTSIEVKSRVPLDSRSCTRSCHFLNTGSCRRSSRSSKEYSRRIACSHS